MYVVILLKEISPLKNIHMCTDKYIRVFLYISYLFLAKCQTNYRYLSDNFFICLNFFCIQKSQQHGSIPLVFFSYSAILFKRQNFIDFCLSFHLYFLVWSFFGLTGRLHSAGNNIDLALSQRIDQ